jgi:phenylacetate-CoA ligase
MNRWVAKHLAYLPAQRLQGVHVRRYEPEVTLNQYLRADELQAVRDQKVRSLVAHAYRSVPYYKRLFDETGIAPDAIASCGDLQQVPILTKRTVLDHEADLLVSPWHGRVFNRKTSGSTGMTLHFKKKADALARNDAVMFRCYGWYGIGVGDRQARFWGVPVDWRPRLRENLKDLVANRVRISAFDLSPSSCAREYRRIRSFGPDYFYGYTSAIYAFAEICTELGLSLDELPLKAVICTAEKMYPHHRAALERAFACPVVDEYGSSENGVIAFQCRLGRMHMMSDHLAIEFVDEAGRSVAPGERGRIVITDLSSYAMPLIRYDIGDVGTASNSECTCGVTLPLMEMVEGRKEDFIRTESGTLVHAAYLCYTLKDDAVREFKMYQKSRESLIVQIVKSPKFTGETEQALEARLRTALGSRIAIRFEYLESIPREASGKLRYFVSEIEDAGRKAGWEEQPGPAAWS